MKLTIRMDDVGARRYLDGLARNQLPFATKVALQRTAQAARKDIIEQFRTRVHQPVRWTTGQVYVEFANRRSRAIVYGLREDRLRGTRVAAAELLQHLFVGGPRVPTGFERRLIDWGYMSRGQRLVIGRDVPVNASGNIPPSWYQQMISQLRIATDSAQNATDSTRSKVNRRRRGFFWSRTGQGPKGLPGVYLRTGRGKERGVMPVLVVVSGTQYRARISMADVQRRALTVHWPAQARAALDMALRTAR